MVAAAEASWVQAQTLLVLTRVAALVLKVVWLPATMPRQNMVVVLVVASAETDR